MKENNSNKISIILMLTGGLFVIIAGCIFVTTAWEYIPVMVKKFSLLIISLSFFGGYYLTSRREEMRFTPHLLYYLGTAFAGFFAIAMTGGMRLTPFGIYLIYEEQSFITLLVLLVLVTVKWLIRTDAELYTRITQSVLIILTARAGTDLVFDSYGISAYVSFVIILIAMVGLRRLELMAAALIEATAMLFILSLSMVKLVNDRDMNIVSMLPFSLTLALALMVLYLIDRRDIYKRMAKLQLICGTAMLALDIYAIVNGGIYLNIFGYLSVLWIGMIFWMIAEALPCKSHSQLRAIQSLDTIALNFLLYAVIAISGALLPIPKNYQSEMACVYYAIGIVLLGYIWYDKHEVKTVQFILTCLLLFALLLADAAYGGLGNVLIYGGACVIMILIAAVRNRREYVIAASVALTLRVLYITRAFWLSIAWWVYLFVAGIALIVFAVIKERNA